MTIGELQAAIRTLIHGAGLQSFTLTMRAHEHHPGRVDIQWSVFVSLDPLADFDQTPLPNLYFTTCEAPLLLDFLRERLPKEPEPAAIASLGPIPHSEYPQGGEP